MLDDRLLAMDGLKRPMHSEATRVTPGDSSATSSSGEEDSWESSACEGGALKAKHVAAISFALTNSGPYGVESCVRTFGPAWCMVGLCVAFLCYTLPEILMTSDLMMVRPLCNGGVVTWAERGLGKPAAAMVALNFVAYAVLDLGCYPALIADYVNEIEEGPWVAATARYALVLVGLLVNLFKLEFATSLYMATLVAVLLPFAIGFGVSSQNWDFALREFATEEGKGGGNTWGDLNLFVATMLWLNTGWDALGTLAQEVSTPRSLVRGLSASAVAGLLSYALSVFGALAAGPGAWEDGYLAVAYGRLWGPLKPIIVFMGAVSNFLLYASALGCTASLVQAMADPDVGLRLLPTFLAKRLPGTGAPAAALLAISAVELFLASGFKFEYLLQVSTLLHVFVFWASLAAFVQLRFRAKDVERSWGLPGGRWGAAAVACLRVPVLTLLCVCACGVPSVLVGAVVSNFFFLLLAAGWMWHRGATLSTLDGLDSDALAKLGIT